MVLLFLVGVLAALLWRVLFGDKALIGFDRMVIWYPFMAFARQSFLEHGSLPLWLPGLFGGLPFVESLVPSLCYPTDIIGWLIGVSPNLLFAWDAWLHLVIAGGGSLVLARSLGISGVPAVICGIAYMLNGHISAQLRIGTVVFLRGAAWLPWIFWATRLAVLTGQSRWWISTGALMALLPLSATYQLFAYLLIGIPIYAFINARPGTVRKVGLGIGIAFGLAGVLAAIMVLPGLRYYSDSLRALPGHRWGSMAPLEWPEVPLMLIPSLWGSALSAESKYFGVLVFGLALVALWRKPRACADWIVLATVATVLALGTQTPLGSLIERIPLIGRFRIPSHWLALSHLAMAVMAGLGAREVIEDTRRNAKLWATIWIGAAVLLAMGSFMSGAICARVGATHWLSQEVAVGKIEPRDLEATVVSSLRWTAGASALIAGAGVAAAVFQMPAAAVGVALAVVSGGELFWRASDRLLMEPPGEVPGLAVSQDPFLMPLRLMRPQFRIFTQETPAAANTRLSDGLDWIQGYHGAPPAWLSRVYDAGTIKCPQLPGIFRWLNTRFYIMRDAGPHPDLLVRGPVVNTGGQKLWLCEDPEYLPRAFFVTLVDAAATDDAVLDTLCRTPATLRRVFVAGKRGPGLAGRKAPGTVGRLDLTPNRITAEVECAGDGFLFFSEAWYPAWTGFVDGVRVPVERVNVMFRGIAVPQGWHVVEMVYISLPFRIGLWMSLLGWSVLGSLAGVAFFGASRERTRVPQA